MNKPMDLTRKREGLRQGTRRNGRKYTVRDDRQRYFFPEEWLKFMEAVRPKKRYIFEFLINTGARIDEALHVKPKDFDWDRNNVTLRVTKIKAAKGEKVGRPRTFTISSQLARKMREYIKLYHLQDDDLLFPMSSNSVYGLLKRTLYRMPSIQDAWAFSLHNIRKTHGNYLKALGIDSGEICYRLGHDLNTFIKHYGSANIFDRKDKMLMIRILGDVYGFK